MEDEALLQEFLAESREHLSGIEADLLAIEEAGDQINENLVNKVFRAAHSIKGGSGFFDLPVIQELAHRAETVLSQIRSREMVPNPEVINILLQAFDKLRELLNDPVGSAQADISDFVVALGGLTSSYLSEAERSTLSRTTDLTPAGYPFPILVSEIDLLQVKKTGKHIYAVEYDLTRDLEEAGKTPLEVLQLLESCGTVLDARVRAEFMGSLEDFQIGRIPFLVVFATVLEPGLAEGIFDLPSAQVRHIFDPRSRPKARLPETRGAQVPAPPSAPQPPPASAVLPTGSAAPPPAPVSTRPAPAAESSGGAETTLRVQISVLENLMNLAGELVLSRNQLRESISRGDARATFLSSQRINMVTSELQEAIMQTRLQPIGNLFGKFPRVVRDLAQKLEKDIQLTMDGKDVELDKSLLEGLSDPLTHMVRNAVDHGIETPDDRTRAGKSPTGRVHLKAFHEAGQVVVEIADDGKGLDPERLAASAVAKGLLEPDQAKGLSDKEKVGLIFLPGFSTAAAVTDVSGRGVGMDVVKTNLDRLGGKVEIDSRPGQGTLFRIKLPLTLAIIPSLVLSVGEERFAVPQVNIAELIRVAAEQVQKRIEIVGDSEVLLLRGELIPLVRLADLLAIPRTFVDPATGETRPDRRDNLADRRSLRSSVENAPQGGQDHSRRTRGRRSHPDGDLNIVVISTGLMQYGLVVDRLHTTEEIVVKPLGRHLKGLAEYAGATIMGDGRVALILDAAGLAAKASLVPLSGSARARQVAEEAKVERAADAHAFLTFHNGPGEFCAIPLDLVLRVERIQAAKVETLGGRRTMQYRGSSLPLLALEDASRVSPLDGQELAVIIFNAAGREIGLLGAPPVDVLEARLSVDQTVLRQTGIAGSAVVKDRTLLMVDVFELVEATHPEWIAPAQGASARDGQPAPTLLLAEDSDFFRGQVKRYLEQEGYRVLEAPDGEAAWELLLKHKDEILGLVTDIEMPRLTGLGLAARIRAHPEVQSLPIVGLTSLAAEDDIARGKAAGIDDYQIKLDRDRLLEGLRACLASRSGRTT